MRNVGKPCPQGAWFHLKERDVSPESEPCPAFSVSGSGSLAQFTPESLWSLLPVLLSPGACVSQITCGNKSGKDVQSRRPSSALGFTRAAWLLHLSTGGRPTCPIPLSFCTLLSSPAAPWLPGRDPHCPLTSPVFLLWPLLVLPHQGEPCLPRSSHQIIAALSTASLEG